MARAKSNGSPNSSTATIGFEADIGKEHADTFLHPDLRVDYVLANGSMSSSQSGEGEIWKN